MFRDSEKGREKQERVMCEMEEHAESLASAGEVAAPPGTAGAKVINFKERASEMRIKSTFSGAVHASDAAAAAALGEMFLNGEGVTPDPVKAARFLAIAAKGEIAQSMHQLALLHLDGVHVAYDAEYAIALLQGARAQEHLPSITSLAELYIFAQHCERDIEQALELLYAVVFENDPSVFYYLAYIYDKFPMHRDPHEAAYWYRRAAEFGHYKSQIRLAALYATGLGVPRCQETAEAFLEVALESGTPQDPKLLYWQGERMALQPETRFIARALMKAAAEMHFAPAQRMLLQQGWR
ncbi:sel1 repeat family protein [Geomonas sp. RF6]|uniref:tetratricopeptide repeat protein n=1 Tax=Geomonas sp. RF6 TaxID=2897342 RepID=UPI001E5CE758|nr:tetratricopeptide repeat protein [Geomonas sp. RF6]UFS68544.1 sel1 repeat family protein [Geomonas sp. RF6]